MDNNVEAKEITAAYKNQGWYLDLDKIFEYIFSPANLSTVDLDFIEVSTIPEDSDEIEVTTQRQKTESKRSVDSEVHSVRSTMVSSLVALMESVPSISPEDTLELGMISIAQEAAFNTLVENKFLLKKDINGKL